MFKGYILSGAIETKCTRCHTLTTVGDSVSEPGRYALLLDRSAKIVNATHSATDILGYSHDQLLGKHYDEISKAMSRALYEKIFETLTRQSVKKVHYQHGLQVRANGEAIPVDVRFRMITVRGEPHILCICNASLREHEGFEVYGTDIANVCDGYAEIGLEQELTLVSDGLKGLLGYDEEEMVGRPIFEFMCGAGRDGLAADRTTQLTNRLNARVPFRIKNCAALKKDAQAVDLDVAFMPVFDEAGAFNGHRVLMWTVDAST